MIAEILQEGREVRTGFFSEPSLRAKTGQVFSLRVSLFYEALFAYSLTIVLCVLRLCPECLGTIPDPALIAHLGFGS